MAQDGRGQPVVVNVGECRCPGTPHTSDSVTLRGEPSTPMGVAAWAVVREGGDVADLQGRLTSVWLHFGIASWTFVDENGRPESISPENIERLLPFTVGLEVADRADALYSDEVLRPLVERQKARSSPPTPTESSTPASTDSGATPPMPSSPSLPAESDGKPSEVPAL